MAIFVVGKNRLQRCEDLESGITVEVGFMCEERPKIDTALVLAGFGISFHDIGVEEEQDAEALPVERTRLEAVVLEYWPQDEIALQVRVHGVAVEWPDAGRGLAFTTGKYDEWPRCLPFVVFLFAVIDIVEQRPDDGRGVAQG